MGGLIAWAGENNSPTRGPLARTIRRPHDAPRTLRCVTRNLVILLV